MHLKEWVELSQVRENRRKTCQTEEEGMNRKNSRLRAEMKPEREVSARS